MVALGEMSVERLAGRWPTTERVASPPEVIVKRLRNATSGLPARSVIPAPVATVMAAPAGNGMLLNGDKVKVRPSAESVAINRLLSHTVEPLKTAMAPRPMLTG